MMSVVSSLDTQELVSSKENIQPLRRGRDTSKLCAALQAETDSEAQHELEKQRNEFEIRLRSSNSEDPLADWCSYIHWIEQSFPKRGEEGKLNTVLQKCLKKFKDNEQYMNDIRFVKLCIKYAELEDNTVELLSQIHRHGIGINCAELYIAWAEKYAVNNCFKKANAVYERGLKCSAQPIQLLQDAHQRFQAFLVRKMMDDREMFQPTVLDSNQSPQRKPYNILQSVTTSSKEVIPSNRTGSTVIGPAGKLKKIVSTDRKPKSNKMISIFVDDDDVPSSEPVAKLEKIQNRKTTTKENTVKPGPWNNKKNRHVPFKVDAPSTCPFQVHVDEGEENSAVKSKNVPSSVLKSHKTKSSYEDEGFADAPLFYPEPFDPTKKPMYCKEQVYAGGLEFQFEELRAIQYRKKFQEMKVKCLEAKLVVETIPSTPQAIQKSPPKNKAESHVKSKSEKPKLRMLESTEKVKSTKILESAEKVKSKPLESAEKVKSKSIESTQKRKKSIFSNPIPIAVLEEQIPSTDYSMNQTIHTKEALSEMQQLWFSKPPSPVPLVAKSKPAKATGKSILKSSKPCFSLYVDESCLENFKAPDQDKPLDLTLKLEKSDEENSGTTKPCQGNLESALGGVRKKVKSTNKIIGSSENKENCFKNEVYERAKVPFVIKVDDEDKENGVPDDYCGPVGKSNRKVSGILTPAENVEIAQLSDEEVEIDEDEEVVEGNGEDDDVPEHDFSSIIRCNTTAITETWNFTKGFQFPRGESTPNMRKSIHNKPDCDEHKMSDIKVQTVQGRVLDYENQIAEANKPVETEKSKKYDVENGENGNRNLSVIAETSREYRSSSSASSGATSTLAFRHSKNYPYTPSGVLKNSKFNLTASQTATFHKGKSQNYTGYEASCESSQTALKTPVTCKENAELNSTVNLMKKLNTIESVSMYESTRECDSKSISDDVSKLEIQNKEVPISDKTIVHIDPFAEELIEGLLQEVEFPKNAHTSGYFSLNDVELPPIKLGTSITLGAFNYKVKKILGEGSYARIYGLSNSVTGESLIAKYQKPAFPWEFYVAREIQLRIKNSDLMAMFMDIESAYFFKNCSVLLTRPVEFGDLLAVIKKMQEGDMMSEMLAMHFTCQIIKILETLHSCKIIHGDIKPDNFLLRHYNDKLQLQLIDFGRSIDMSLFPEGTNFTRVVTTEGLTTVEMKSGKPWTYQIDYYGAAVCGHCLLFGDYMKVVQRKGVWNISKTIPRYWAKNEWNNFFISLINVESCSKLPNLEELRKAFEDILSENSEIDFGLYRLNNLLNNR